MAANLLFAWMTFSRKRGAFVALATALLLSPIAGSTQTPSDFIILRGAVTGGIWVELASDSAGNAELAILDGLPGTAPSTRYITLTRVDGTDCRMQGDGGTVVVSPCATNGANAYDIKIGGLQARGVLDPISPALSVAWPQEIDFTGIIQQCQMASLIQFQPIVGTPLGSSVQSMSAEVKAISPTYADNLKRLPSLRTERLRLYSVLELTPSEKERKRMVDEAIAGRGVMGSSVSLSEASLLRDRFEKDVVQHPARVQARAKLMQIEKSLSEVYDVRRAKEVGLHYERLKTLASTQPGQALIDTLAAGLPRQINDLVLLEGKVGEIDGCLTALGADSSTNSRKLVLAGLVRRSDEIVTQLWASVKGARDSETARTALQSYEGNAVIVAALTQSGRASVLDDARKHIDALVLAEDKAQKAAIQAANAQAAHNSVPVTAGTSSRGRLNVPAVASSVYFIYAEAGNSAWRGTGFAVSDRHIVTNNHVAEGAQTIYVVRNGGTFRNNLKVARVLATYPADDLAVLEVSDLGGRRLPVATSEAQQGAAIWVLGYIGVADDVVISDADTIRVASLSEGIISRYVDGVNGKSRRETRMIQHTANTGSGSSGSPIFDACNRVVGVHNSGPSGEHADRAPTGISSTVLTKRLKELNIPANFSSGGC